MSIHFDSPWDDPGGRISLGEYRRRQMDGEPGRDPIRARKASMICAYCFGEIHGDPHVVRGRPYHPPIGSGRRSVKGTGCYEKDKALVASIYREPKVDAGQLVIEDSDE